MISAPIKLTREHFRTFQRNGFVVLGGVLDHDTIKVARERFESLFAGKFETGLCPDEWNWRPDRDAPDLTRQICNAWKSDRVIASIVLRADIGRACADLKGWPGARINQDNVIWKPPGAKALGFHQDDSYQRWIQPAEIVTCWITLDDTYADQGTIEYVPGSHNWPVAEELRQFHAPENPLRELESSAAAASIKDYEIVPIEVPAGTAIFHHGRIWHGSRNNKGLNQRRAVVAHCMSSEAKFHESNVNRIYSRYKRVGTVDIDESFFPILWAQRGEQGYRTHWLDDYMTGRSR